MKYFKRITYQLLFFGFALIIVSCSAGKAEDAFKKGDIKVGSSYEEMVSAIGEPTNEKSSDKGMLATYSTVLTNSHVFILLEKKSDGNCYISAYTDENVEAIEYSKKLGLPLFW